MVKWFFNLFENRPFMRQMATLMTGSAASQVITIVLTPFISRLFSPADYGLQGLYLSLAAGLQAISCMRYEYAIVLPESNKDANALTMLSLSVSLFMTFVILTVVLVAGQSISVLLAAPNLEPWLIWIPLTVFLTGVFNAFSYFLTRQKRFKEQAVNDILASASSSTSKLLSGWMGFGAPGLLLGILMGQFVPAIGLSWSIFRKEIICQWRIPFSSVRRLAIEYKQFPLYLGPQALLNSLSQAMPAFILASYSSVSAVGHFAMARTLLLMPANFILQAFRKVYYPTASEQYNRTRNIVPIFLRSTFLLAAIGLVPFLFVFAFGPKIFVFFLGNGWSQAGQYARWVGLWVYLILIMPPSTVSAQVLRMQRFLLFIEILLTLRVLVLWWVINHYDALAAIAAFSATTAVVCFYSIVQVYFSAKRAAATNILMINSDMNTQQKQYANPL
jgi:O-antigen/teichoic acid export membrane protein